MSNPTDSHLTKEQQAMIEMWQKHTYAEFVQKDVDAALETMTANPYVINFPVLTGGIGVDGVRAFYGNYFIPQMPPDIFPTIVSQTVGYDRIVEESVFKFTHSVQMDWLLPGIAPTNKLIELGVIGIIQFEGGKVANEHLHWDQASLLAQLGLLDPEQLPIRGAESARRLIDPTIPINALLQRATSKKS